MKILTVTISQWQRSLSLSLSNISGIQSPTLSLSNISGLQSPSLSLSTPTTSRQRPLLLLFSHSQRLLCRVLEWGDGYYNGDIKTRKTVQSMEINAYQLVLQRCKQLRELYESLSVGESSPQARRRSISLSPEDLSDKEWYYLVCMSFMFNNSQGLLGRTLANVNPYGYAMLIMKIAKFSVARY
ncbi:bHLH-MYC_N domain-containing protein [Cephalotus follicularis]|uniref:BHLH-MYC_N domain-containing protein n=1 Tax=Cephalotus follicularis TaxID=3775 RepID=A0A1Q3D0K5_CEPFO|nr:bHLH-MYC_N domain-containing protein [Cephalotus follicularis]